MPTESVSARNVSSLIFVLIISSSILGGSFSTGQDMWLSLLIGCVAIIPVVLMYCRINALCPEKDIFAIIQTLFGKFMGGVLICLLSLYALHVGALALRHLAEYTVVIALRSSPRVALMVIMMVVVLYLARSGFQILGRWSAINGFIVLFTLIFTLLIGLKVADFSNLTPAFVHAPSVILNDAFGYATVTFGEVMLVMILFGSLAKGESARKALLPGILIGAAGMLLIFFRNVTILGADLMQNANFPSLLAVRLSRLGSFFERFETLISVNIIVMSITKAALALMVASTGFGKLCNVREQKQLLLPTSFLMLALCTILFEGMPDILNFVSTYRYYALPFQLLIPLLIWIVAEVKVKKQGLPTTGETTAKT